jgi:hypothetical protein
MNEAPDRPAPVTQAGWLMIVFGTLIGLLGLLFALAGAAFPAMRQLPEVAEQLESVPEAFGVVAIVVGIVLLGWGITQVVAGIFAMRGRSWARIAGIVVGIIGGLVGLAWLVGSLPNATGSNPVGLAIAALFAGAHVYAIWVLIRSGEWFAAVDQVPG